MAKSKVAVTIHYMQPKRHDLTQNYLCVLLTKSLEIIYSRNSHLSDNLFCFFFSKLKGQKKWMRFYVFVWIPIISGAENKTKVNTVSRQRISKMISTMQLDAPEI